MASKKAIDMILDEYGFSPEDKGVRTLAKKNPEAGSCHADVFNGKFKLQGIGNGGGYNTGYLSLSEAQLRQLLTIFITNHV